MAFFGEVETVTTSRNCDDSELDLDLVGQGAGDGSHKEAETGAGTSTAAAGPVVMWGPVARAAKASNGDGKLCPKLLVVAVSGAAAAYAHTTFASHGRRVGVVQLPKVDRSRDSLGASSVRDNVCIVQTLAGDDCSVLVVRCQYDLPTDVAPLWTQALFDHIAPQRVVVLDALRVAPAELRSAHPTQRAQPLRFLKTDTADGVTSDVVFMASPCLSAGLCASLVTHCQVFGVPAVAAVALQGGGILWQLLRAFDDAWSAVATWEGCDAVRSAIPSTGTARARFQPVTKALTGTAADAALYM